MRLDGILICGSRKLRNGYGSCVNNEGEFNDEKGKQTEKHFKHIGSISNGNGTSTYSLWF